ncbi:MAG TPA: PEGA domain-containing protein [Vicinamibacterales bacterium]|nr:PEGA domain-containing protein [Vicinamibacterales bacterium]
MNRAAFVAVLAAAIFAASVFFVLTTRAPDDVGDGAAPDPAAVANLPARPDTARDTSGPAPEPPAPPPAPTASRRRAPGASSSAPGGATADTPAPTRATLRIASDVPGAQVFLDRRFIGATPATASDLAPGEYQLNVSAPGYDTHVATLSLTPGERDVRVTFREVRLHASLGVVHKHRFGSCEGTLTATPDGIRYDTTHKEDAFRASLLELDTFEVDYLNKNLRVQPRKGQRYDFTDPDGSADRLFVFHRDVDRARERLKNGEKPAGR